MIGVDHLKVALHTIEHWTKVVHTALANLPEDQRASLTFEPNVREAGSNLLPFLNPGECTVDIGPPILRRGECRPPWPPADSADGPLRPAVVGVEDLMIALSAVEHWTRMVTSALLSLDEGVADGLQFNPDKDLAAGGIQPTLKVGACQSGAHPPPLRKGECYGLPGEST